MTVRAHRLDVELIDAVVALRMVVLVTCRNKALHVTAVDAADLVRPRDSSSFYEMINTCASLLAIAIARRRNEYSQARRQMKIVSQMYPPSNRLTILKTVTSFISQSPKIYETLWVPASIRR